MSVQVKICGITRPEDAEAAIACGADIIGLNFYPPSPRALTLERAREIREVAGDRCAIAGVFVNAARDYVEECRRVLRLDLLQFHGDEDIAALQGWAIPTIRAIRLEPETMLASITSSGADYLLLDTFEPGQYGGTGRALATDRLAGVDLSRVFIAGGLSPDNVASAARLKPYAVDVASGVESTPGLKDAAKLRSFIANAKSAR
jgi:phosphoribosylanthranilate isomerase